MDVSGQLHAPPTLHPGKELLVSTEKQAGLQREKIPALPEIKPWSSSP